MWLIWLFFTCFVRLLERNWNELNLEKHFTYKVHIFRHDVVVCCALALKVRRTSCLIMFNDEIMFNRGISVLKLSTRRIER